MVSAFLLAVSIALIWAGSFPAAEDGIYAVLGWTAIGLGLFCGLMAFVLSLRKRNIHDFALRRIDTNLWVTTDDASTQFGDHVYKHTTVNDLGVLAAGLVYLLTYYMGTRVESVDQVPMLQLILLVLNVIAAGAFIVLTVTWLIQRFHK